MVAAGKMTVTRWQWKGKGRRSPLIPSLSMRQNPANTSRRTQALSGNRGGRKGHEAGNSMPARSLNRSTEVTLYPQADITVPSARGQGQLHRAGSCFSASLLDQRPLSKGHMPALELGGGGWLPRGSCLFPGSSVSQSNCYLPAPSMIKQSARCHTQNISNPDK